MFSELKGINAPRLPRCNSTPRQRAASERKVSVKWPIGQIVAISIEIWPFELRIYRGCRFSSFVSIGVVLNCADGGVLTRCPPRRFSLLCPLLEWCVSRMQATGRGRVLGHVTRGATGCRRHVRAFQAAHAVIRSSAPGCELSVTTTVPLPVSNVVLA